MERRQRLGVPLEAALGARRSGLEIDPRRDDVHQHVGARPGPELAIPGGRLARRSRVLLAVPVEVLGQRGQPDLDIAVARVHELDEVRQHRRGDGVIGPVHGEERAVAVRTGVQAAVLAELGSEPVRDVEQVRAIPIAADQVLRVDGRTIR